MTHKTGPRKAIVDSLYAKMFDLIMGSPATMGEIRHVMQHIDDALWRKAMRPWEETTCPTCPKSMDEYAP